MRVISVAVAMVALAATSTSSQPGTSPVAWNTVLQQPAGWYRSREARAIADVVLAHQRASGGWPKNTDMTKPPDREVLAAATKVPDETIDNGATITELRFLSRVASAANDERYRAAMLRGLDYLLSAQYPNGGWPQFFPLRDDYSRYVTFNDNATINVMRLLDDAARGHSPMDFVDARRRTRAASAVDKGIDVILSTQIRVGGVLTGWCAQYDAVSLEPRGARTYEHASISGQESVEIVRFLMHVDRADRRWPQIVSAIEASIAWLQAVRVNGQRVERRPDSSFPNGFDTVVVADPSAPPLWARFYEIGTNRPIFSGRDGIIRERLSDIEHERRTGYAWLGTWPQALLEKDYPAWRATLR